LRRAWSEVAERVGGALVMIALIVLLVSTIWAVVRSW
jgi:hypothetical protein